MKSRNFLLKNTTMIYQRNAMMIFFFLLIFVHIQA